MQIGLAGKHNQMSRPELTVSDLVQLEMMLLASQGMGNINFGAARSAFQA